MKEFRQRQIRIEFHEFAKMRTSENGVMVNLLNPQLYSTLQLIRQRLTPEQQEQLDELSLRQKRELVALADERADGTQWAALNFCWLRLQMIKYLGASPGSARKAPYRGRNLSSGDCTL